MQDITVQQAADAGLPFIAILIGLVVGLAIGIAIMAVIAWLFIGHYKVISAEHRKMEPGKVWLLVIPLFNLYWIFPVMLGLSDSYKAAFAAKGRTDVGDCARQLGLFACIAYVCSVVPCVQYLAAPAALVLLIIYLVKASELRTKLLAP